MIPTPRWGPVFLYGMLCVIFSAWLRPCAKQHDAPGGSAPLSWRRSSPRAPKVTPRSISAHTCCCPCGYRFGHWLTGLIGDLPHQPQPSLSKKQPQQVRFSRQQQRSAETPTRGAEPDLHSSHSVHPRHIQGARDARPIVMMAAASTDPEFPCSM